MHEFSEKKNNNGTLHIETRSFRNKYENFFNFSKCIFQKLQGKFFAFSFSTQFAPLILVLHFVCDYYGGKSPNPYSMSCYIIQVYLNL
jgi:hypothetical protein